GLDIALEARGDRRVVEGEHEPRGSFLAEIRRRGQLDAESDGLVLPVELAGARHRIGKRRHADMRIDMLDAALRALAVLDDLDRTVLDLNVLELDVALRRGLVGLGPDHMLALLARIAPLGRRRIVVAE